MSNISFISYREIIVKILHISVHLLCFQVIETMLELWRWSSICGKEPSTWCEQTIVQRSSNYSQTERLHASMTFTSNGKLEFVPRDQVPLYLSFTVLYFYTKICSSTQFLIDKNFLSCFYLLIFYLEKFSTSIWRLPFAVYVKLKLSNNSVQAETSANIVHDC